MPACIVQRGLLFRGCTPRKALQKVKLEISVTLLIESAYLVIYPGKRFQSRRRMFDAKGEYDNALCVKLYFLQVCQLFIYIIPEKDIPAYNIKKKAYILFISICIYI